MKIQKIKSIKGYKSFQDYSWQKYFNNESFHDRLNIFYGENGSGKSSICNIIKSAFQVKDFTNYKPQESRFDYDDQTITYSHGVWDKENLQSGNIAFFDKEFVDKNVHLGIKGRGTLQGEQEQESGKMIIEFDSEAINLRNQCKQEKEEKERIEKELSEFKNENLELLDFKLSSTEIDFYRKYKEISESDITELKSALIKNRNDFEITLQKDKKTLEIVNTIQEHVKVIDIVSLTVAISTYKQYELLFNYPLKEKAKIDADQEIVRKIIDNKEFFEKGMVIYNSDPTSCPFCQSKNEEKNINGIIEIYNQIYDTSYKNQFEEFVKLRTKLISELTNVKKLVDDINLGEIFIYLKKLEQNYEISNIYSVEEEEHFSKPECNSVEKLSNKLTHLDNPIEENISSLYIEVENEIISINKFVANLNVYINNKNELIQNFKQDNTDEKIGLRIELLLNSINQINLEISFIDSGNVAKQRKKEQFESALSILEQKLEDGKNKYKNTKERYEEYCSNEAFSRILLKIEEYFGKFSFNFKLQLEKGRSGQTKEYPFAFKVLDVEGKERDFIEGLSEGELQILSICFFFAFQEIQNEKEQRVLIFDDPITSLDNSNLSRLVDLIASEEGKYSQIFIFTHHRSFFKFLRNRFSKKCNEFNIIRNKDCYGGSFICNSGPKKFIEKMQNLEKFLTDEGKVPNRVDLELITVEYGQFLRYEVERFIKNDLLYWGAENNFNNAIEGIKNNKKIADEDLDIVKSVYSFCNWTTSHVDVGEDNGLEQLKTKINDFISVLEKYEKL